MYMVTNTYKTINFPSYLEKRFIMFIIYVYECIYILNIAVIFRDFIEIILSIDK